MDAAILVKRLVARFMPFVPRCKVCGAPISRKLWKRGGEWTFVDMPCSRCRGQRQ
jgi:hypothetical protein